MPIMVSLQDLEARFTPQSSTAIVTLILGEEYSAVWNRTARRNWARYCLAQNFDLIAITTPLDRSEQAGARSPAWQKCLILSQPWSAQYERIIWLDADILIAENAPSVIDGVPETHIGGVVIGDQWSSAQKQILLERTPTGHIPIDRIEKIFGDHQNHIYEANNIKTLEARMISTGVLVLTPGRHRALLESAYDAVEYGRAYEQPALSHAILENHLLHELNPRFNWMLFDAFRIHHWGYFDGTTDLLVVDEAMTAALQSELKNSYFLHFCQLFGVMEAITRSTTL
jgi:hypothetical protein